MTDPIFMLLASAVPNEYVSIFGQAMKDAGKFGAYAVIVVGLTILLLRLGIVPALRIREETRQNRRTFEEKQAQDAHVREMEIENVRLDRDRMNAESQSAMKDSLHSAQKIHEMAASVVTVLDKMLQSILRERGRERARSGAHDDQG